MDFSLVCLMQAERDGGRWAVLQVRQHPLTTFIHRCYVTGFRWAAERSAHAAAPLLTMTTTDF